MHDDLLDRLRLLNPVTDEHAAREARRMHGLRESIPRSTRTARWLPSRRSVLLTAATLAVVVLVAPLVFVLATRSGRVVPGDDTDQGWVDAGRLEDLAAAGVVYLEDARVFVLARPGGEPYALSAVSPHSPSGVEELLKYCRPFGGFREGEHGAQFDDHGEYMTGPASSGMLPVRIRITADGILQVLPFPVGDPPPRGTASHLDPQGICTDRTVEVSPGMLDLGDVPYWGTGDLLAEPTVWFGPDDRPLVPATLSTYAPMYCRDWPPAILQLIEPLGTEPSDDTVERIYVADPTGVWADRSQAEYSASLELPPSAEFTGFRSVLYELWIDPATLDDEVYLVRNIDGDDWVQRLPRVPDLPVCLDPGEEDTAT